jgi:hypothetical protein
MTESRLHWPTTDAQKFKDQKKGSPDLVLY